MLITCKECGGMVSDKAVACPHCGYPMKTSTVIPKKTLKYKRLSNGYGQIRKLQGRRRKPYAVYPPTKTYKDNGTAVQRPALGYFANYQDALACLIDYNNNPYDVDTRRVTFAQVYEMFFKDKFTDEKKKYSASSKRTAQSAFNKMSAIHNRPIRELKTDDLQEVIDACTLKHASLEHMVFLMKSVFKFAMQHDYIEKDYSRFIRIKVADDDEKGVPFSESEIKTLWKHSKDYTIQIVLIMIYSGFRISELETLKIDAEKNIFVGGLKTKAGKNRTVPIHSKIQPFVGALSTMPFKASEYRSVWFYPTLEQLGLSYAPNGAKRTPHDCRHTFSWLADKYGMDNLSKHLIMGHSLGGDVESSVYGHRTVDELRREIEKIQ